MRPPRRRTWTNLGPQISAVSTLPNKSLPILNNDPAGLTCTFDLGLMNIRIEHVTLRVTIRYPNPGHLDITLISPSGVASRLAEPHIDYDQYDEQGNKVESEYAYLDWTFMTVHNWGENCAGEWTLKIVDTNPSSTVDAENPADQEKLKIVDSPDGALEAAELTVFGTNNVEPSGSRKEVNE